DVAADDLLRLSQGDWLELLDAELELEGRPGQLVQATAVQVSDPTVQVEPTPDINLSELPRARRWHGVSGVPPDESTWLALENGIEVVLGGGDYRSADYWAFPARV